MKTRLTLFSLFLVAACGNADPSPNQNPVAGESAVTSRQPSEIGQALQIAAAQFAIPQSVLQATAYAQTRLFFVPGQAGEASGDEPQYGIFALRSAAIRKGAQLAGISDHDAQTTVIGNVQAAAALLRSYADEAGIDRTDLAAWAGPIARLSALPTEQAQADFIHNVVYKTLREGLPPEIALGHGLSDAPHPDLVPQFAALVDDSIPYAGVRYSGSVWKPAPSSNFTVGRSTG
ncbi:MAG TPA: hypothetical protein PLY80_12110, partial [Pseudomonadota bacterium]|nr:hypothetical protein [Pseudomonadota bacterium]